MPPYKKPKSLEKICLNAVASLVVNTCGNIEKTYGNVAEELPRCKLKILQGHLVSYVQPLYDELSRVILEEYFSSEKTQDRYQIRDCRCLLTVITGEQTKTLNLGKISKQFDLELFSKNQISKLKNIVQLDIQGVNSSDEIFEEISKICRNLRDISIKSNLEISSKDSVYKLLECTNLQFVKIDFVHWNDRMEVIGCVGSFVKGLRKLRHISYDEMGGVLLDDRITSTSLWKLTETRANVKSVRKIIELCPFLVHLNIDAHFASHQEKDEILNILTESSQQFQSLQLHRFAFDHEMEKLLKRKGKHLLKLTITLNAGTITYNDICTIGANCPNIERLEIRETYSINTLFGFRNLKNQISKNHPRVFTNLKSLTIDGDSKWDQSLFPLMLNHAYSLENISLKNVFAKNGDGISKILDVNPLTELRSFKLVAERCGSDRNVVPFFDKRSIQRLVDSCTKLTSLELDCVFEDCAILYLEKLERKIIDENLDLRVLFRNVKNILNVCEIGVPGGYDLYHEY